MAIKGQQNEKKKQQQVEPRMDRQLHEKGLF